MQNVYAICFTFFCGEEGLYLCLFFFSKYTCLSMCGSMVLHMFVCFVIPCTFVYWRKCVEELVCFTLCTNVSRFVNGMYSKVNLADSSYGNYIDFILHLVFLYSSQITLLID